MDRFVPWAAGISSKNREMQVLLRLLIACLTVLLAVGCGSEDGFGTGIGRFTPTCKKAELGHLEYGTFAHITDTTAYVLSGDFRETYCGPYLTTYVLKAGTWNADGQIILPLVRPGVPAIPIHAEIAADDSLWIADRRGQRLLHFKNGRFASIQVGSEVGRFALGDVAGDVQVVYAADATLPLVHEWRVSAVADGKDENLVAIDSIDRATESGARATHLVVTPEWVLVSQDGSGFVSRWNRRSHGFDTPIVPFEGEQPFAPKGFAVHPQSGDVFAILSDRHTVVRLGADEQFEAVGESAELGRPTHIRMDENAQVLVYDSQLGLLRMSDTLHAFEVVAGSPQVALHAWAYDPVSPDIGLTLLDSEIRTW